MLAPGLGLRDDELEGIAVVGIGDRVVENAYGSDDMACDANFAREVRRVGKDLLGLGLELHSISRNTTLLQSSLDAGNLSILIQELIDGCVQHVSTAVDSRQSSEALGELSKTIERVDVGGLSVASHRVNVKADTVNDFLTSTGLIDVIISLVESHGVTNKVPSGSFKAEFVVHILHRAGLQIQSCK